MSARWQLNLYKDINYKEEIETFSLGGKRLKVPQQQEEIILFWFLLGQNSQTLSACRLHFSSDCQLLESKPLLIGSQSLVNIVFFITHTKYWGCYVISYFTVTSFTSYSIKTFCAAAVESFHSVCAGPVVLAGMTCAVIDICV